MNDFEKCKKLINSIGEFADKTVKLKEEVAEKIKAQRILDEDALKAEILEDKDWKKKKKTAKRNREDILILKKKLKKIKERLREGGYDKREEKAKPQKWIK